MGIPAERADTRIIDQRLGSTAGINGWDQRLGVTA
jgi:hypothetical protein